MNWESTKSHGIHALYWQQNNNHCFPAIIHRSTCVNRHLRLRTGGFCWCTVFWTHALADGNQHIRIREKTLLLNSVIYTVSVPTVSC